MTAGSFEAVLEEYLQRMKAREPLAMYRIGDGELLLADGEAVGPHTQASQVDRWQAPNYLTALGQDLRTVLETQEPWAHFGIPCLCCNASGFHRLSQAISHAPTFPANLFINANYPRFRQFLQELAGTPVALIVNERATTGRMPFQVVRAMHVPDNCVAHYEADRLEILAQARDFCRDLNRCLVLVSAGPLSEALIFVMWNENPNNTYVDVGSALDELSYGQKTRSYMWEGNEYATRCCSLPEKQIDDLHESRFVRQSDAAVTKVFADLPSVWWSRGHEYAWAMNFASAGQTVLDAACGMCHPFKLWLAQQGCNTFACDIDPAITNDEAVLAEIARHLGGAASSAVRAAFILHAVKRVCADIGKMPYADATFDRVFCISVIDAEIRRQCLSEFARVLKPGGLVVITLDVPPTSLEEFGTDVAQSDLKFVSTFNPTLLPNALVGSPPGYGLLRCFRALLQKR